MNCNAFCFLQFQVYRGSRDTNERQGNLDLLKKKMSDKNMDGFDGNSPTPLIRAPLSKLEFGGTPG
jgi:hypothetical protein